MLNRSALAHYEKILFKCAFRAGIGCTTQEHLHLLPTAPYELRVSYTQNNNDNNTELYSLYQTHCTLGVQSSMYGYATRTAALHRISRRTGNISFSA